MMNKILIYIPIAPKTPKIYGRTLQSIFRLEWPKPCDIVFGRNDNPVGHKYDDVCLKHNEARDLVLNNGYESVFFIENDMVLPPDALLKLDEVDADVAYGLYCNRHGWHAWLAFSKIEGDGAVSVSHDPDLMKKVWGKPYATDGAGMGCTLIRRNVLEKIKFRTHEKQKVADDWLFSEDCRNLGFVQAHHFGVICGHIKQNSTTLWPDVDSEGGYRLEFPEETEARFVTAEKPFSVNVGLETMIVHGYHKSNI